MDYYQEQTKGVRGGARRHPARLLDAAGLHPGCRRRGRPHRLGRPRRAAGGRRRSRSTFQTRDGTQELREFTSATWTTPYRRICTASTTGCCSSGRSRRPPRVTSGTCRVCCTTDSVLDPETQQADPGPELLRRAVLRGRVPRLRTAGRNARGPGDGVPQGGPRPGYGDGRPGRHLLRRPALRVLAGPAG